MEKIMTWIIAILFSLFIAGAVVASLIVVFGWPILIFLPIICGVDWVLLEKLGVLKKPGLKL